jgi:hypothetical protein
MYYENEQEGLQRQQVPAEVVEVRSQEPKEIILY